MSNMIGQADGKSFEDTVTTAYLQKVEIFSGKELDSLRCYYGDGTKTALNGGEGGSRDVFELDKDEAIITINIWAAWRIDAIQFQTTKGRVSDKFGGGGAGPTPHICSGYDGSHERALMGFKGKSGYGINQLEPIWSTTRELGIPKVSVGRFMGGYGGGQFDMLSTLRNPLMTVLKTIVVNSAWRIDAVQCIFQDNEMSKYQGGHGGEERRFELREKERIVRIEGRSRDTINQLKFVTNLERHSEKFGGDEGSYFDWKPPFRNMSLLCFQGMSGKEVDGLAPVWAADPPCKVQLKIKDYEKPDALTTGSLDQALTRTEFYDNGGSTEIKHTFSFTSKEEKSSTISLSEQSRSKVGGKFTMEVTTKGSIGIPSLAEASTEIKAGIEISGEHEWGKSVMDSTTLTSSSDSSFTDEFIIHAGKRAIIKQMGYVYRINGQKWSGVMTLTYDDGDTRDVEVQGSYDSYLATQRHVEFREEKLPANK